MDLKKWLESQRYWAVELLLKNDYDLNNRAKEFSVSVEELRRAIRERIRPKKIDGTLKDIEDDDRLVK